MKPKKTPRKEVRRELVPGYDSIGAFLISVTDYTRQEFIATTPGYRETPLFQEFYAVDGIEVLHDIFNRLNTEFQDRNEIHWILTSRWEGRFPERHIFLIACGIWKFILLHSEEVQEGNNGAAYQQGEEIGKAIAQRAAESEVLSNSPQNGEGGKKPKQTPAIRRNEIIRAFCQKRNWGKTGFKNHRWELRPLMEELDGQDLSLPLSRRYKHYDNYCELFDDAKRDHLYHMNKGDEAAFDDSEEVYEDFLIETLSRGIYPRQR